MVTKFELFDSSFSEKNIAEPGRLKKIFIIPRFNSLNYVNLYKFVLNLENLFIFKIYFY